MDKFEKTKTTSFNNIVKRKTCISKDDLIQEVYKVIKIIITLSLNIGITNC